MAKNTALTAFKAGLRAKGKGKHHARKMTIPLAIVGGIVPGLAYTWQGWQSSGFTGAMNNLSGAYTGYNPTTHTWSINTMRWGTFPLLGGIFVHKIASALGVNKAIARAGIPFIRI